MGHDLRGPVAPIRMAVQMLRMGPMTSGDQSETLSLVERQVDLLLANIDDLSELLRINAGTFEFNPTRADLGNCFEFLEGRSALVRELQHTGTALEMEPWSSPVLAQHDPRRLVTVLEFFVSKFARHLRGGTVRLSLRPSAGLAVWSIGTGGTSVVEDAEFQYVLGNSPAVHECEGRALLVRELVVLHELQFLPLAAGEGLAFSMPAET